jgi:hypothetical protein
MNQSKQNTPDRWSSEETREMPGAIIVIKPYSAFKMFAVFKWIGSKCETLYDGSSESEARKIFEG